ncbi:MAG: DUF167 domain-containing protein [Nitrospiria bacterium]
MHIRVRPRASINEISVQREGPLRLRLKAVPAGGAANDACIKYLADLFDLPKTRIEIVRGTRSRDKWIWFKDIVPSDLVNQLEGMISN